MKTKQTNKGPVQQEAQMRRCLLLCAPNLSRRGYRVVRLTRLGAAGRQDVAG